MSTPRRHNPVTVLAVLFTALAMSMVLPGVAAAHSVLVSSDPSRDAVLQQPPARVSGTFNEPLQPLFPALTIVGPEGRSDQWQQGAPSISGAVVSVAMNPAAPAGKYTVNYRVTSEDGHVVEGSWSFTTTQPGTGTPDASPADTAQPHSSTASPAATPRSTSNDGQLPLWVPVVGVVVAVGAALIWQERRR